MSATAKPEIPHMRLHWSPKSPFVRKVMITAHELGLTDAIDCMRSVAIMGRPDAGIMADNPLNKIPTLVLPDGSSLFDSLVICMFLDDLVGGDRILPAQGAGRWAALRLHALANGFLDLLILLRNEREKPAPRQTPEWLAAFAFKVSATLRALENDACRLAERAFDIGHITLGCALGYLDFRFGDLDWRQDCPELAVWFADFSRRPSVIATEVVDG